MTYYIYQDILCKKILYNWIQITKIASYISKGF